MSNFIQIALALNKAIEQQDKSEQCRYLEQLFEHVLSNYVKDYTVKYEAHQVYQKYLTLKHLPERGRDE